MAGWPHQQNSAPCKICGICTRNIADFFCECSGSKKYFCSDHFSVHTAKHPGLLHNLVRADLDAADVAGIQARTRALAAGKAELLQSLSAIDKCRTELESLVQRLVEYLRDQLAQLDTLKTTFAADIEDSVEEVESSLAAQEVRFLGKYSDFLRCHVPGSLLLFSYQLDQGFIQSCSSRLLTYSLKYPTTKRLVRSRERSEEKRTTAVETFDGASGSGWTCIICGAKNVKTALYCSKCYSDRAGKWTCKFCQAKNRATTTWCEQCHKSKNNSSLHQQGGLLQACWEAVTEPAETLKMTYPRCGMRTLDATHFCTLCKLKTPMKTEPSALPKCATCGRSKRSEASECSCCMTERKVSRSLKCRQCGRTVVMRDDEYCDTCRPRSASKTCLKCGYSSTGIVCKVCGKSKFI